MQTGRKHNTDGCMEENKQGEFMHTHTCTHTAGDVLRSFPYRSWSWSVHTELWWLWPEQASRSKTHGLSLSSPPTPSGTPDTHNALNRSWAAKTLSTHQRHDGEQQMSALHTPSLPSPSPTLVVQAGFWSSGQWWSPSSLSWPEGPTPSAVRWPSCHSCWARTSCTCASPGSDLTENRGWSEQFSSPSVAPRVSFISPSGSSSAWSISSLVNKLTNHSNDFWSLLIQMKSTCRVPNTPVSTSNTFSNNIISDD